MTLRRLDAASPEIPAMLALIRTSFAYMEARIDPPSSMLRLTETALRDSCATAELWVSGDPIEACAVLTPKPDALYIGKLAVAESARGKGLARQLVELAAERARAAGLGWLELQVRIELVENHAAFARMGFAKTGETAHPGYDRPTSITMRRPLRR
ncbi:N-acetyltransferase [Poseidonocella sp. HB161398]|uniref:GNAT family N-acetyltransferase n=1 Tax=Poseidonocella sp. HB161398 TaxID=2320855 RepID=UPI00110882D2|nr:GNAT family N-acetyltransferase [Poseidonocella sp. HB161398]